MLVERVTLSETWKERELPEMCCVMTGDHTVIPQPFDNSETKPASCRRSRLWPSASQSCNLSTTPLRIQHSPNEVRRNSQQIELPDWPTLSSSKPSRSSLEGFQVLENMTCWISVLRFFSKSKCLFLRQLLHQLISSKQHKQCQFQAKWDSCLNVANLWGMLQTYANTKIAKFFMMCVCVLGGLVAIIFLDCLHADQMRTNVTVQVGFWILIIHILVSNHTQISAGLSSLKLKPENLCAVFVICGCIGPVGIQNMWNVNTKNVSTQNELSTLSLVPPSFPSRPERYPWLSSQPALGETSDCQYVTLSGTEIHEICSF